MILAADYKINDQTQYRNSTTATGDSQTADGVLSSARTPSAVLSSVSGGYWTEGTNSMGK